MKTMLRFFVFFGIFVVSQYSFGQQVSAQSDAPNATVTNEVSVFLYKPEYSGLFGISSLFANKLNVVLANYKLPQGARIRVVEKWDTGLRGYRYVRFIWKKNGEKKEGWTWAGKRPNYWIMIKPDNTTLLEKKLSSLYHTTPEIDSLALVFSGIVGTFVGKAYANNLPIGVPTQVDGFEIEKQAGGWAVQEKKGSINFFSLIWTSLFVTTVGFVKDGIKEWFRKHFKHPSAYYSCTFLAITALGFSEAIVVKMLDARFFS